MRIIGGRYRGRGIQSPETEDTRPISDAAREAVFNMLGDIEGLSFLDAYAGSGSVAIEALSRGASQVVAVERAKIAEAAILDNAQSLGIESDLNVRRRSIERWLEEDGGEFDIVFADPPFDAFDSVVLRRLSESAARLFILKHSRRQPVLELANFELVRSRRYGDSVVSIYKRA